MVQKGAIPKKVLCPFCLRDSKGKEHRIIAVNGIGPHVRKSHPEDFQDFQENRKKYVEEYLCDANGKPVNRRYASADSAETKDEIKDLVDDVVSSEFSHVPISVVSDISQIDEADLSKIIAEPIDDKSYTGVKAPDTKSVSFVGDQRFVDSPESVAFEECVDISTVFWSIPSFIWGQHLVVDSSKINSFARQLHRYCVKKDLDPSDWFFDEFGIVLVSIGMIASMRTKHIAHKKEQGAVSKEVKKDQEQKTDYIKGGE